MALVWVILGVVLLLVELRHLAFYALFGAAGAFAAAVVAVFWPELVPLQLAVAALVAALGVWAVRPLMNDRFQVPVYGRLARGVHGSLVGEEVSTLDVISADHTGHVFLAGERWLALSGSGDAIPPDTRVLVTGVEGTRLIVWPVDGYAVPPAEHARAVDAPAAGDASPTAPDATTGPSDGTGDAADATGPRPSDHHEGEPS